MPPQGEGCSRRRRVGRRIGAAVAVPLAEAAHEGEHEQEGPDGDIMATPAMTPPGDAGLLSPDDLGDVT
jgi:hypothetical protein